jgi:hypothetical protein
MPAPVDPARFLGVELRPGALMGAFGPVVAGGVSTFAEPAIRVPAPALAA